MSKILKGEDFKRRVDLKTKVNYEDRTELLEASERGRVVSKEKLNAQEGARAILEEAKHEASRMKKEARELLGQVKEEVRKSKEKGENEGREQGLSHALEYLDKIYLLKGKMFENIEPQVVKLAFEIAEKVIGKEIQERSSAILGMVRQALGSSMGSKITVRVNPSALVHIQENESQLSSKLDSYKTILFKGDESISEGGCVVESEIGTIDARLEVQLAAIKKALGL